MSEVKEFCNSGNLGRVVGLGDMIWKMFRATTVLMIRRRRRRDDLTYLNLRMPFLSIEQLRGKGSTPRLAIPSGHHPASSSLRREGHLSHIRKKVTCRLLKFVRGRQLHTRLKHLNVGHRKGVVFVIERGFSFVQRKLQVRLGHALLRYGMISWTNLSRSDTVDRGVQYNHLSS